MNAPPVSVIIVSRERPSALIRCLTGLQQSDHPCLEVVVVADALGLDAIAAAGMADRVKRAPCDVANISVARNIGITRAAGSVVAFIDDDAVPEPSWLSRLVAPFADAAVAAAGGFVRGRNGLSFQWKARTIDRNALETPLAVDEVTPTLHPGTPDRAIKTEGTNCAFRRDVLADIGGFDPAYAFYLDEADVNMRLALAGHLTAIVPGAEVHHGFAASDRRSAERVPLTLLEIGASMVVFLRRHGGDAGLALTRLRREQRQRLLRLMVSGAVVPGDVSALLRTLEAGIAAGQARPLVPLAPLAGEAADFLPLPGTGPRRGRVLIGRPWHRQSLGAAALMAVEDGEIVTVLRLSPTARPHRMRFHDGGYWEQVGGVFGPSVRDESQNRLCRFHTRIAREIVRLSAARPIR